MFVYIVDPYFKHCHYKTR